MLWQSASGMRHAVSVWAKSPGLREGWWKIIAQNHAKGEIDWFFLERRTNLASERHQMMFAEAGNIDITNQDHFVMVLCKDCVIDHVCVGRNCLSSVFGGGNEKEKKRGGRGV